jgi:hypothetical protein
LEKMGCSETGPFRGGGGTFLIQHKEFEFPLILPEKHVTVREELGIADETGSGEGSELDLIPKGTRLAPVRIEGR